MVCTVMLIVLTFNSPTFRRLGQEWLTICSQEIPEQYVLTVETIAFSQKPAERFVESILNRP